MDGESILKLIKRAAVDAVNACDPCDFCFGTVISRSPLKISIEQKFTLTRKQLVFINNVINFNVNDTVILLRKSGGQQYLILGKAV